MKLFYHSLNLIPIQASSTPILCEISCNWHSWIHAMNCKERSTLRGLWYSIICHTLSKGQSLHPIILLMADKHLKMIFRNTIHMFGLTNRRWVKCDRHPSIHSQLTAYLSPIGWGKLRSLIWNHHVWQAMKAYNFPKEQLYQSHRIYWRMAWVTMSHVWESIHHNPNCLKSLTFWLPNHNIYRSILPWFFQYR